MASPTQLCWRYHSLPLRQWYNQLFVSNSGALWRMEQYLCIHFAGPEWLYTGLRRWQHRAQRGVPPQHGRMGWHEGRQEGWRGQVWQTGVTEIRMMMHTVTRGHGTKRCWNGNRKSYEYDLQYAEITLHEAKFLSKSHYWWREMDIMIV